MKPRFESIYGLPVKLLSVIEQLDPKAQQFVRDMQAMIKQYGEKTYFSVKQVRYLRSLHYQFCVRPASEQEQQEAKPVSKLDELRAKRDKLLKKIHRDEKLQQQVNNLLATSAPLLAVIHADRTTVKMTSKKHLGWQLGRNKALIKNTRYDGVE